MLKKITLLSAFFISLGLNAQTVVFSEDFESSSTITSLVNSFNSTMPDGPSPCSQASRGVAADFNSTTIDFLVGQNATNYMATNPESPCGGYYTATVVNPTPFDFSSSDSLVFKCRYYMSSTLNWGPTSIEITFDDGTNTDVIPTTSFNVTDAWTDFEVTIANTLYSSASVDMTIVMASGDGVALDDIQILNYAPVTTANPVLLGGFTYAEGSGPSLEQSFTLFGEYLQNDVVLTAPSDFEISTTSGSGFTNSLNLTPSAGTVNEIIYVRMVAGLTAAGGPYSGDITITSPGTVDINIALDGNVTSTVGLEEEEEAIVSVYPNPFTSEFNLELPLSYAGADFEILDLTGKTIFEGKANAQKIVLKPDLLNGMYFLKIQNGNKIFTQKLLKR